MRNRLYPAGLALAVLVLSACGGGAKPKSKGEALFVGSGCTKCHQIGSAGHAWGPDLTFIGVRKSPEWLDAWLKNPHAWRKNTVMPNFNLKPEARAELVAFLSEQKGQAWEKSGRPWLAPELSSDKIKQGEVLFDKAGCVACHGEKGSGGYPNNNVVGGLIPPLTKVFEGYTKEELKAKIKNGVISEAADPSQPKPMIFMPKWSAVLSDAEIDSVVDYLFSLAPKGGKASDW